MVSGRRNGQSKGESKWNSIPVTFFTRLKVIPLVPIVISLFQFHEVSFEIDGRPGNLRNAVVCDAPYLQNEIGDPRFLI